MVDEYQIVRGRLRLDRVEPAEDRRVEDVMEPGPATGRADADLTETLARMTSRHVTSLVITNPDGVLLGELRHPD